MTAFKRFKGLKTLDLSYVTNLRQEHIDAIPTSVEVLYLSGADLDGLNMTDLKTLVLLRDQK
ncbi:MAG: hypothetical protein HRT90_08175 [Candidatus Margulisbacteria bacterium]|nr:hypothetical protein [Candidatus Margulisiibacteriota bacterium]